MNDEIRMQISAFVDGELPENEAELLIRRLSKEAHLRQEVAEYLALGRLMRSEEGLSAADRLHERISMEIDAGSTSEVPVYEAPTSKRAVKTMAGFAIAATVALAAIFALQQTGSVNVPDIAPDVPVVANDDSAQGVPSLDAQLDQRRELFRRHHDTSSRFGDGLVPRVVDLRFSEILDEDTVLEEIENQEPEVEEAAEEVITP